MNLRIIKDANLQGVAAGSVATLNIEDIATQHAIFLNFKKAGGVEMTRAEIIADIEDIVIRIGGEAKITASAEFLLDLYQFWGGKNGSYTVAGAVPIYFTRPNLPTAIQRAVYAWGMAQHKGYEISVSIKSGASNVQTVEIHRLVDNLKPRVLGPHITIDRYSENFSTTGNQQITHLPHGEAGVAMLAMHLEEGSGGISDLTIKKNNIEELDEVSANLNLLQLHENEKTAQSGYYHVDFTRMKETYGHLNMFDATSFMQIVNWGTAPGSYDIYMEQLKDLQTVSD